VISPAVSVTFRPLRCGGIRDDEKEQRENSRTESSFVRTDQEQRPVRQNQCKNRSQFCRTDQEQRPVLSEQIKNRDQFCQSRSRTEQKLEKSRNRIGQLIS